MNYFLNILLVCLILIGCKDNSSTDIINSESSKQSYSKKSITDVLNNEHSLAWVNNQNNTVSLALHFNLSNLDTVSISYSNECWLMFPFKVKNEEIIIFWDTIIDSKYDFEIIKALKKIDKKFIGQPFIILKLENDTTLVADYIVDEIIEKINKSDTSRLLFPKRFFLSNEF